MGKRVQVERARSCKGEIRYMSLTINKLTGHICGSKNTGNIEVGKNVFQNTDKITMYNR